MRTITLALLAALLVPVGGPSAHAGEGSGPRLITVTGRAEVKVVPGEVRLTLGVETIAEGLADAKAANDERVETILVAAEAHGIEKRRIRTDFVGIEPRYGDHRTRTDLVGYAVTKTIAIHLEDVSRFESLLSSVLEAGANRVQGVEFQTSELRRHRDRARTLAIEAAREKAEAMARRLDQRIGRPHSITEGAARSRFAPALQNVSQSAGPGYAGSGGLTPSGEISVEAEVTVSFELVEAE